MTLRSTFDSLSATFPLLLLPSVSNPYVIHDSYVNPPLRPTLWVLGPPDANGWSPDWLSTGFMRFIKREGLFGKVDLRWCSSMDQGVNGKEGKLPCLHLTDGDLLTSYEIHGWISKYQGVKEQLQTEEDLKEHDEATEVSNIEIGRLRRKIEQDIAPIFYAPPPSSSTPLPARILDNVTEAITRPFSRALTFIHDRLSLTIENLDSFTRIPTADKTREAVAELRRVVEEKNGPKLQEALSWAALYELQVGRAGREWEYSGVGLEVEKWESN